eukprot:TRINITY_DN5714_c0_g1_i11.p5 TRINITY_DN5714_c0_g1~~TRINITY_DN5714_c0_g1_i11.p5  ORF type:complete len:226 (-),score=6.54 TRINITY_DN5714_c0_g1_i11:3705-4382(-)
MQHTLTSTITLAILALTSQPQEKYRSADLALIIISCAIAVALLIFGIYYYFKYVRYHPSVSYGARDEPQPLATFKSPPSRLKIIIMPGKTLSYGVREEEERSNQSQLSLYAVSLDSLQTNSVGNSTRTGTPGMGPIYSHSSADLPVAYQEEENKTQSRTWHGGKRYFQLIQERQRMSDSTEFKENCCDADIKMQTNVQSAKRAQESKSWHGGSAYYKVSQSPRKF